MDETKLKPSNDPEALETEESSDLQDSLEVREDLEGSELAGFDSAEIEDLDVLDDVEVQSILEGVLFASEKPVSMVSLKVIFKGTDVSSERIKGGLERLASSLGDSSRGVALEAVGGGYQLRTKQDHLKFLKRNLKAKAFRLSGPALEVLAITAYKQPLIKSEIDEIRGVESGHLLRALMERGLISFDGKSELPGRPMQYATTRKFLDIFGLRNLKELPTLSQIDDLIPEGILEDFGDDKKESLSEVTSVLSQSVGSTYSDNEEELEKIQASLQTIATTTEFFEEEKRREKARKDKEKAESIREALLFNEEVSERDRRWLVRYDEQLASGSDSPIVDETDMSPALS